jgi:3-hydroxyanthranilate 3,4-dioxygenase
MHVNLITPDGPQSVHIREGQMWVLPGNLPHSPQRPEAGSIGVVIERVRAEGTLEKFQWYCGTCAHLVYEVELRVRDIVADLPPVFAAFYADERARTCGQCGTLHPGKS